jgi:predicted Zn-dependent protease
MRGEQAIRAILTRILSLASADQVEAIFTSEDSHLTRFANSTIHQNVSESNAEVRVKTIIGKRVGVASTNDLSDNGLQKVVESAQLIARFQPEQPELPPLPKSAHYAAIQAFSEATAACSPERRARAVAGICGRAKSAQLVASGAFATAQKELAIANSSGLFAYHPSTLADLNTVIMSDDSSGYASRTAWDVDKIDAEQAGIEAVDKALKSCKPIAIEPGAYTVILEEYAVADILRYLSYLGFGALALQEGRSFMTGKLGQQIMDGRISIVDDGLDAAGIPMPFDFEGAPKQRVEIIKNGIANAVVYDAATAQKEGKCSTGHSLPTPNTFGPMAGNLFMSAGQNSKEEMLASTARGLWVTRFHYVNPLHPLKATLTGMTRDGTFLIEKGELARPVKNLRFTQSMIEALSSVEMIGRERHCEEAFFGALVVPALKVRDFTFTGATEF